ncbi:class I SAM-dependent RNA methyltransferase [Alphaproteobacteria bacterium]|nr:class I SAM-dependent RNA methyltransferase [Alphaproteobacteria bacterium]
MRRKPRKAGGFQFEVTIEEVGGLGDGIAHLGDGRLAYVPLTVAGDRVLARTRGEKSGTILGEIVELLEAGPDRQEPPCSHFGLCGGCQLQQMSDGAYLPFKENRAKEAITKAGFDLACFEGLQSVENNSRRRVTFAAEKQKKSTKLGFRGKASHDLIDISQCEVLHPILLEALPGLRKLAALFLQEQKQIGLSVNLVDNGLDILVESHQGATLNQRLDTVELARANDWARVSWQGKDRHPDPLIMQREPFVTFGGHKVPVPAGAFLQPSFEGEAKLTEAMMQMLSGRYRSIADMFSGCGTFAFALAEKAKVTAFESGEEVLKAQVTAIDRAQISGRIVPTQRDLERNPLTVAELNKFDAIVLDPPRKGAKPLIDNLAQSSVKDIVYVSCNPSSWARDAAILKAGGYHLDKVIAVDQFTWTAHVELVSKFRKG